MQQERNKKSFRVCMIARNEYSEEMKIYMPQVFQTINSGFSFRVVRLLEWFYSQVKCSDCPTI